MRKLCAVLSCKNSIYVNTDPGYYMFPRQESLRNQWLLKIRNPALDDLPYEKLRYKFVVCGDHFETFSFKPLKEKN